MIDIRRLLGFFHKVIIHIEINFFVWYNEATKLLVEMNFFVVDNELLL